MSKGPTQAEKNFPALEKQPWELFTASFKDSNLQLISYLKKDNKLSYPDLSQKLGCLMFYQQNESSFHKNTCCLYPSENFKEVKYFVEKFFKASFQGLDGKQYAWGALVSRSLDHVVFFKPTIPVKQNVEKSKHKLNSADIKHSEDFFIDYITKEFEHFKNVYKGYNLFIYSKYSPCLGKKDRYPCMIGLTSLAIVLGEYDIKMYIGFSEFYGPSGSLQKQIPPCELFEKKKLVKNQDQCNLDLLLQCQASKEVEKEICSQKFVFSFANTCFHYLKKQNIQLDADQIKKIQDKDKIEATFSELVNIVHQLNYDVFGNGGNPHFLKHLDDRLGKFYDETRREMLSTKLKELYVKKFASSIKNIGHAPSIEYFGVSCSEKPNTSLGNGQGLEQLCKKIIIIDISTKPVEVHLMLNNAQQNICGMILKDISNVSEQDLTLLD